MNFHKRNSLGFIVILIATIVIICDTVFYFNSDNYLENLADSSVDDTLRIRKEIAMKKFDEVVKEGDKYITLYNCDLYRPGRKYKNVPLNYHAKNTEGDTGDSPSELFKIFIPEENNKFPFCGWVIDVIERYNRWNDEMNEEEYGLKEYFIKPYEVAFVKQKNPSGFTYYDDYSVEEALDDAFEFFTKDSQSDYSPFFLEGKCSHDIYRIIESKVNLNNGSYYLESPMLTEIGLVKQHQQIPGIDDFHHVSYMYNDKYRVYIEQSNFYYYSHMKLANDEREYVNQHILEDLKSNRNIIIKIIMIISVFIIIATLFYMIFFDEKRLLNKRISPKNFIKPYDKVKIENAIILCEKLKNTKRSDDNGILNIKIQAEELLDLHFVSKKMIKSLKNKCNPASFLSRGIEQTEKANQILIQANKDNMSLKEYNELLKQIEELKMIIP